MYLTLSKRFELSTSRRLANDSWTDERNSQVYGPERRARYGVGKNYTVYFIFHGPVDRASGMLISFTDIKQRLSPLLISRYDHKFLNLDTPPFDHLPPTPENVAKQLFTEVTGLFADLSARPVACHLVESDDTAATAYSDGRVERHYSMSFSAARVTRSPHLSEEDNRRLFGIAAAPSGHGHNYRLRLTLGGEVSDESGLIADYNATAMALAAIQQDLDHKNLSTDVPDLGELPSTTEILARYLHDRFAGVLPVARVRLYEMDHFFAEFDNSGRSFLAYQIPFDAAHRLHAPGLTDKQNREIFDKCNNPHGHGHRYRVEATVGGELDQRTGALYNLTELIEGMNRALEPWQYRHLDLETDDFKTQASTGENIVTTLWPKMNSALESRLVRLRLWETPNNRFTMRADAPPA